MSSPASPSRKRPAEDAADDRATPETMVIAVTHTSDSGEFDDGFFLEIARLKAPKGFITANVCSEDDSNGGELEWHEAYLLLAYVAVVEGEEYADQVQRSLGDKLSKDECSTARAARRLDTPKESITINGTLIYRAI